MAKFNPCPDCGSKHYPLLYRKYLRDMNGNPTMSVVYAMCDECGFPTQMYDSVEQCAEAWNNIDDIDVRRYRYLQGKYSKQ